MEPLEIIKSYRVAPNIALIKYWGKYHEELIIPLNLSISLSLDENDLCTETQITFSENLPADIFILNTKETPLNTRIKRVIQYFRDKAENSELTTPMIDRKRLKNMKIRVESTNNFPTAAGLASSSSGIACLVMCMKEVFGFNEKLETEVNIVARIGSGSAVRSLYGGCVEWIGTPIKYLDKDSSTLSEEELDSLSKECVSSQLYTADYFSDISILILVAKQTEKEVPSTDGMRTSVETSALLKYRLRESVQAHIQKIKGALLVKNWHDVFEVTMRDSNQFHAVCLDTFPPISYMNSVSFDVITLINKFNSCFEQFQCAYTFDAGPNAVIFVKKEVESELISLILQHFETSKEKMNENLSNYLQNEGKKVLSGPENSKVKQISEQLGKKPGRLQVFMRTGVGSGPKVISS